MGSGKSTVGPRVAEELGWSLMDLDDRIEERAGKSIPALFANDGEARFRAMEAEVLRHTAEHERAVVALGGGTLADPENLQVAKQSGLVVYLHATAGELARRLRDEAAHRPLLQDEDGQPLSGEALRAKIAQMLGERAAFYEQAHATVRTDGQSVSETVSRVVHLVHARS